MGLTWKEVRVQLVNFLTDNKATPQKRLLFAHWEANGTSKATTVEDCKCDFHSADSSALEAAAVHFEITIAIITGEDVEVHQPTATSRGFALSTRPGSVAALQRLRANPKLLLLQYCRMGQGGHYDVIKQKPAAAAAAAVAEKAASNEQVDENDEGDDIYVGDLELPLGDDGDDTNADEDTDDETLSDDDESDDEAPTRSATCPYADDLLVVDSFHSLRLM